MTHRRLRAPFVATAVAATSLACGSTVTQRDGSGGATASSASGTSNQSSASSSSGNPNDCPAELPVGWDDCALAAGESCSYDVSCQSGPQTVSMSCSPDGYGWQVDSPCSWQADSCPDTQLYCQGAQWFTPTGTNPPSPCPSDPPPEGEGCFSGGMGGVWMECGYACGATAADGWTIATCAATGEPEGQWIYDGACEG